MRHIEKDRRGVGGGPQDDETHGQVKGKRKKGERTIRKIVQTTQHSAELLVLPALRQDTVSTSSRCTVHS